MKQILTIALTSVVLGCNSVAASVSDAEFAELKAQIASMAQRLNTLEAENRQLRETSNITVTELGAARADLATVKTKREAGSWSDSLSLTGDFRYRYDEIDKENSANRDRHRIRARSKLTAQLPDNVEIGLGLSTGSDDPISSNQTLGNGNTSKNIVLSLAYFKWEAVDNLYLEAGKFSNPLYRAHKNGMIWDGDLNPEGFNLAWRDEHLFATLLGNWLESDSKAANHAFSWGAQVGTQFDIGAANLTTAVGYYDLPVKGNGPYYDNSFFGNASANGVYEYDYRLVEVSAELAFSVQDMPVSVWGDYVQNQDPDNYNTGWVAGVQLGRVKGKGSWQIAYQYQDLEADAVLGLFTDSDFADGGTDSKGSTLSGAYGINSQWQLAFTWFIDNKVGEQALQNQGGALDYNRFMIDTIFKY